MGKADTVKGLAYLLFSLMIFTTCEKPLSNGTNSPNPGVYYWQTTWEFDAKDADLAKSIGLNQLYLRLFDLDWDYNRKETLPKGKIALPDSLRALNGLTLTPVVFIVNRVFREEANPEGLAEKVGEAIDRITENHPPLASAPRWQIDCDWTPGTRDAYFSFLRKLQSLHPTKTLSVTVRLHQYRDRTTNGIPPVTEGLLMCYNMEPVSKRQIKNAIYNLSLMSGYLKAPPYPLPLDAALPLFEWGAAFREDQFLGITAPPASMNTESMGNNQFLLLRDTTSGGRFLRAGDEIRYDGPESKENLYRGIQLLRQKPEIRDLLFFDWQPDLMDKFGTKSLTEDFYKGQ